MKKLEKVTFERFSFKKYQKYQQQGLPVRLVTGRGVEVHIIAEHVGLNKDMFIVETETRYYKDTERPYVDWFGIKPNGVINGGIESNSCNRVYIQHGCIDLQEGDIVLQASSDSGFYFMYMLDRIARLTKEDGIGLQELTFMLSPAGYTLENFGIDGKWHEGNVRMLAENDGLTLEDWESWFCNPKYDLSQPMAIIHFTKFRYK